jgi:putative transposase
VDATPSSLYKGHRFPVEIISHCVWLYHRFPLSLRDVEQMMAHRGVSVSYDTIVRHEAPGNRAEVRNLCRWTVAAVR